MNEALRSRIRKSRIESLKVEISKIHTEFLSNITRMISEIDRDADLPFNIELQKDRRRLIEKHQTLTNEIAEKEDQISINEVDDRDLAAKKSQTENDRMAFILALEEAREAENPDAIQIKRHETEIRRATNKLELIERRLDSLMQQSK